MSDRPWSGEPAKATPVGADRLLILDSADANQNKLVTISSLPAPEFNGPWTATLNIAGQTLDDVGVIISNSANPASTQFIRMNNDDEIAWRNFANNGDLFLRVDDQDRFVFAGGNGIDAARDEIVNINFLESDSTNFAASGFVRMAIGDQIAWRNGANTNDNTIGYPGDVFTINMNGSEQYSFGGTNAQWNNNNLIGLGRIEFSTSPTTANDPAIPQFLYDTGSIPNQILISVPNNEEIAMFVNAGEEFTFSQTIADFHNNGLVNLGRTNYNQGTITFNATQVLDFDAAETYRQITLTGDLTTLSTTNRAAGKVMSIILEASGADRNVTFNTDWATNPNEPVIVVPNGAIAIMSFYCTGTAESNVTVGLAVFRS